MRERAHINIHIFLCGCFESHEMNECLWEAFPHIPFVPQQEENARFCAEAEEGLLEGCWFFSCPPPLLVTCRVEFLPIYLTSIKWKHQKTDLNKCFSVCIVDSAQCRSEILGLRWPEGSCVCDIWSGRHERSTSKGSGHCWLYWCHCRG